MKVLHVLNELRFSGAEIMLKTASSFWQNEDINLEILSKGSEAGEYRSILENCGYKTWHIPYKNTVNFIKKYRSLISKRDYDVVHIHTEHLNFWVGFVSMVEGVTAVIRTVHNAFLHGGKTRLKRVVQRGILRAMGVEHVSIGKTVETTERKFLYNPTRRIPNWYDSDRIVPPDSSERCQARQEFGLSSDEFVIVSVGNCSKRKNHTAIFRALSELQDSNITYLHVGEEKEGYPERNLASKLGVRNQVQFLGLVEEVGQVLHAGDVYIMPSFREGASIAVREAMGSGLVCILSDVPGLRDHKDLDGVFMTGTQPDALSSSIEHVRSIPKEERLRLGRKLSKEARERYGIRQGAQQYAKLYRQNLS
jgi:glycosyltransferase involved in cell wall biosynthesis